MNLRDLVPSAAALKPQAISLDVLREKYCKDNETSIEDVNARVANALADVEPERRDQHREAFLWALQQGFLPAGRIQSAAGTPLAATLINCFVQPVGDSIAQADDGHPGEGGRQEAVRPFLLSSLAEDQRTMLDLLARQASAAIEGQLAPVRIRGTLYVDADLHMPLPVRIARRGVVRSFQISAVFPHLTVLENVRIGLQRQLGTSYHFWKPESSLYQLNERARELLDEVDLGSFADTVTVNLPYGRKRALEDLTPFQDNGAGFVDKVKAELDVWA